LYVCKNAPLRAYQSQALRLKVLFFEYPRPEFNRNTEAAVDDAWKKAIKLGYSPPDLLEALRRKKAILAFNEKNKSRAVFESFFGAPLYFLLPSSRGKKNPAWMCVGKMPVIKDEKSGVYA
jgi:hypothetical protein